jgi:hypothetical protein
MSDDENGTRREVALAVGDPLEERASHAKAGLGGGGHVWQLKYQQQCHLPAPSEWTTFRGLASQQKGCAQNIDVGK